ncbi:MAG: 2-hydroxyacyl-CoA dehydratase subunit D [Candidatus Thorarchaeota archaeon]
MSYGEIIENSEQRLKELAEQGVAIFGYIYPHVPIELFLAHGLTPSLIMTDPSVKSGFESSLQTFSCSLTRNIFSQRANGGMLSLDGILFPGNTCDALQNVSDVWRKRFQDDKVFRLTYPARIPSEPAVKFLAEELKLLSASLENTYGNELSDDALLSAITLTSEFRKLTQFLYACRIIDPSVISYSELLGFVRAFLTTPTSEIVDEIRNRVESIDAELKKNGIYESAKSLEEALLKRDLEDYSLLSDGGGLRLLVVGGMVEPRTIGELFKGVEDIAVFDFLTYGFKTVFTPPVNTNGDRFTAIAKSILGAPLEPTQEGLPERIKFLKSLLKKLSIDGLVICVQSFCDPDEFEAPSLVKAANELEIPSVRLPMDPEFSDRSRLEVKIQTFVETLEKGGA